jgi:RNA polymerase sigma-70 factor (ECF subfamily)
VGGARRTATLGKRTSTPETGYPPEDGSDEGWLLAAARGDEQAYGELVNHHVDRIYAYLLRLTGSPADAEDLLQETFLRVWRKAGSYQPGRVKASTWIHRIAHNLSIDRIRKRRGEAQLPEVASVTVDLETAQIASQQWQRVETTIARLPENQRAALLLCQLQGFSNTEAAHILEVNVRAVESLLARARRTLKMTLLEDGESIDD